MYVELTDLQAVLPLQFLTQALDDDNDGVIDAWEAVQAAAERSVNAVLGVRFSVPFIATDTNPIPPIVCEAAFLFAAEACYTRRGVEFDQNPFGKSASTMRATLRQIAAGEMPLAPTIERQKPSVSIITEPARTAGSGLSV